ncbi:MAG: hypothetical protein HYW13_08025 [Planctomycetes bacterium]|nr:hypothetical protein [Planctomycetota bacterium]
MIVTPFDEKVKRVIRETANQRNRLMAGLADEIFVAYALPGGNIESSLRTFHTQGKQFHPLKQCKKLRL